MIYDKYDSALLLTLWNHQLGYFLLVNTYEILK